MSDNESLERPLVHSLNGDEPRRKKNNKSMIMTGVSLVILVVALILISVVLSKVNTLEDLANKKDSNNNEAQMTDVEKNIKKVVLAAIDETTQPCDDFYQYACGGWLKANPLPADKGRLSRSFTNIAEENTRVLKEVVTGGWPIVSTFYKSCLDTEAIENRGFTPIKGDLDTISASTTKEDLEGLIGTFQNHVSSLFFGMGVGPDDLNPAESILNIYQGGLGLARFYYDDETVMTKYVDYIKELFTLVGMDKVEERATSVKDLEVKLQKHTKPPAELRDPYSTIHHYTIAKLKTEYAFDWAKIFANMGVDANAEFTVNVQVTEFLKSSHDEWVAADIDTIKNYIAYHVISSAAGRLSKAFRDASFKFHGGLAGITVQRPREERCVDSTSGTFGFVLGKYFVDKKFTASDKSNVTDILHRIEAEYDRQLGTLYWLDEKTKEAIKEKQSKLTNQIGYPDDWSQYYGFDISKVQLDQAKYFENVQGGMIDDWNKDVARLNDPKHPVSDAWGMTPQTVNAYYSPNSNSMVFPAGIIQQPMYNPNFPKVMNYGGIGLVSGHELSHSEDDQGSQYGPTGKLGQTWTKASSAAYKERTQCYIDQYSKFSIGVDPATKKPVYVNGELTLGENLADNGGMHESFYAYKTWEKENPDKVNNYFSDKFTTDQLFFVAHAQSWCSQTSFKTALRLVKTDPHSPSRFRVNGPDRNFDQFTNAFKCKKGDKMVPEKRCELWYQKKPEGWKPTDPPVTSSGLPNLEW